jgi:hypothetical protein
MQRTISALIVVFLTRALAAPALAIRRESSMMQPGESQGLVRVR